MLTNTSQVLLRNIQFVENQNVLILNHEADALAVELLDTASSVTALALDFNHHQTIAKQTKANLHCYFGHDVPVDAQLQTFDTVVIYFPKAKALAPYLFLLAAKHLNVGGTLIVIGENKGGVKSLAKLLPNYYSTALKRDNARHCLLFVAELIQAAPKLNINDWVSQYQLATPQGNITICNLVGVFSEKKLDQGTELLLSHLPELTGRVLDFGCGAGVISAAMLKANPSLNIDCIDINAMALKACELTLEANDMKANVYASDGFKQISGKFDGIISNPPFHDGLAATTQIAKDFVKSSANSLSNKGVWQIVANRNLPYADTIAEEFGQVNVPAENNKYKLYFFHK
ncbi:methyltransferase [Shewanella sp. 1_MG-2023]|uniref:methyltransferase n=1 Tax=unclassified Shewanella TaxID=196818 RepID=UPI0026E14A63|nr:MULTISPECIES: methyltransferase [unclassified Shewanella]MDO6611116.1 methyltransferase [Shewanella sp. 7_MG-2023]MDO6771007.1 methyltransferase [Shewanella sp. 2_MG-2023]MDO6794606.1 methyltransferase [Shewanella sp. 1_MG-2023]